MPTIRLGGLVSGIDTESLIQRILDAERIPIINLQNQKAILSVQNDAVTAIKNSLTSLKTALNNLKDPTFFSVNAVTSSDATIATATAGTTAAKSNYSIVISAIASASAMKSGTSLGPAAQKISNVIDPAALLTANTSYGNSLTLGTFTVNGATVTIDSADTLTSTLTKISTATGGVVTGAYNAATDTVTLTSSGADLTLGSGADTSNFLSRSRLYTPSPASTTVTSLTSIGNIDTTQIIGTAASRIGASASLTTGTITINGVSISIDKDVDTLQNVIDRITASTAGVYASYDSIEDRMVLTAKSTGSIGITVADGTSNFASSMKLTSTTSQLTSGNDTTFTVNGGVARKSSDVTIDETESGITGLTISVLKTGTITLNVATDTAKIQTEVTNFVTQFNSTINLIESYTKPKTTTTKATDPASILTNDSIASTLGNALRSLATAAPGTGTIRQIEDVGVTATGDNNLLTFSDASKLVSALAQYVDQVKTLFSDSTNGVMTKLSNFIDTQIDLAIGTYPNRTTSISNQQLRLDDNIAALERKVLQQEAQLVASFTAMEQFQATSANILAFLASVNTSTK